MGMWKRDVAGKTGDELDELNERVGMNWDGKCKDEYYIHEPYNYIIRI